MANNLIQIKRSATNATVPTLANGELAYTQVSNTLWIGLPDGSGAAAIAGVRNPGVLTANQALVANATSYIDSIKVANAVIDKIAANGALGTSGQLLAANSVGGLYWLSAGSVGTNTDAQYTWSNTQTFSNTITFSQVINGTANNANYLGTKSEGNLNVNSAATATTANNSTYAFGKSENALNVNSASSAESANNAAYLGGTAASGYQTTAGLSANVATLTANNSGYLNSKTEANLNVNSAASATNANNASYLGGNTASDLNTYANNKAANAYSNAMSDTLSRNATYTGNNVFSGANTNVSGYLTTANGNLASIKLRTASLISGSYDRNEISLDSGNQLIISGGNYGTQIRSANDGSSWFTLTLDPDTGALIPGANGTMDLGTANKRFGTLYLKGSTIVLGNTSLSSTGDALTTNNLVVSSNATVNNLIGTLTTIASNVNITSANVNMDSAYVSVKDIAVSGNLTVSGTLTTIDTNNISVKDSNIKLAANNTTSDTIDFGIYGLYNSGATQYYSGLFRDHSVSTATNPIFHLFTTTTEPTTIVDTTAGGYVQGTLHSYLTSGAFVANSTVVNITANGSVSSAITANSMSLTTALGAASGGTGLSSYANGDLLYASGSTTLNKLSVPGSVANGQVLMITNNLPAYGTLDGGTF